MSESLADKLAAVDRALRGYGRVLVAWSGGVDSTLLAVLARRALGKANAPAVTADSPSLARADLDETRRLAQALDLEHLVIRTAEVENSAYRANAPSRCYFCKGELFQELDQLAASRKIDTIVYGAIGDDHAAERPGQRAAQERGVRAPLQDAGLTKSQVREAAREFGLPNWNRPQNACLSSRIPHGQAVTEDKLSQIERAESLLQDLGFHQVRVRHLDGHARIEVGPEEVAGLREPAVRSILIERLHALGFVSISINRAGYAPGGADRAAVDEERLD